MNVRKRRDELRKNAIGLQKACIMVGENNFDKSKQIREKQDEVYKQWKFYDEFIKAKEKIK